MTTDAPHQQRYTAVAIALHWIIAFSIIGMIAVGWIMTDMPRGQDQTQLIQLHKSFGITILMLSIARLAWRLMNRPPPEPPMPGWQAFLSRAVHTLFYVLIIAMPLTGWIMASAEVQQHETRWFGTVEMYVPGIPTLPAETRKPLADAFGQVHSNLAWVIIGLLVLHVAGALKHQLVDKDGLLARMAPGLFGRTAGPPDNGHGALWAFGGAIAVFAAIAGLSMTAATPASTSSAPQEASTSSAPAWTVDAAQSSIKFRAAYMGREFEGRFPGWTAQIQLDTDAAPNPDTPIDGYVRVAIPMAQVQASDPYFDENVVQGDWFDVKAHAEAVFEVKGGVFKLSETTYEATGVLKLKGQDYPVRLPFTLNVGGASATMHADITLQRLALGVGRETRHEENSQNPDEDWVRDDVRILIDVVATRQ